MAKAKTHPSEGINVQGFYRLKIVEDKAGKEVVVGDSGWHKNQITNLGFNSYLAELLGAISGSSQIGYIAVGTGGAPAASDTALAGEVMSATKRTTVTAATSSNSKAVQFTATFASNVITTTYNISNVGLYATSAAGTLFAGNTYSSSLLNTNQAINITYTINFA